MVRLDAGERRQKGPSSAVPSTEIAARHFEASSTAITRVGDEPRRQRNAERSACAGGDFDLSDIFAAQWCAPLNAT